MLVPLASFLPDRPVALLEFLAAAARARVVAPHAGVGIGGKCRPRNSRRGTLRGRRGWLATRDEAIRRSFRCHHRRLAASRSRQPSRGTRNAATRRGRPLRSLPRRWPDLDLQLEPALGERRLEIRHQPDEHLVCRLLLEKKKILLSVAPQIDATAVLGQ